MARRQDRRDDTPRLDRQADRMEDQEQRLDQDVPPRSLGGGGGPPPPPPGPEPATPRLDRAADRMEAQERRLDRDEPPASLGS